MLARPLIFAAGLILGIALTFAVQSILLREHIAQDAALRKTASKLREVCKATPHYQTAPYRRMI